MKAGLRTIFAGQVTAAARNGNRDPVAIGSKLLDCQRHRRVWHIHNCANAVLAEPMIGKVGRNVDLISVIAEKYLNFFAKHLAPEFLYRHM